MKFHLPLFVRILGWFFLNLLVLGLLFGALIGIQFRGGLDSLFLSGANTRIQSLAELLLSNLENQPRSQWSSTLDRFAEAYQIQFHLVNPDGRNLAGRAVELPQEVLERLREGGGRMRLFNPVGPGGGPEFREMFEDQSPPGAGLETNVSSEVLSWNPPGLRRFRDLSDDRPDRRTPPDDSLRRRGQRPRLTDSVRTFPMDFPKFLVRASDSPRYWIGVRLPVPSNAVPLPGRAVLLFATDSLSAGGFLLDVRPWLTAALGGLFVSVLVWIPFVRGVTGAIRRMNEATTQIAEGKFDPVLPVKRRDELGRLARAIRQMSGQLEHLVTGQKRFLGDVAHELCSPLARLELSLSILEQRSRLEHRSQLQDLREDLREVTTLVNDLLAFSKASLQPVQTGAQRICLSVLTREIVARETSVPAMEPQSSEMQTVVAVNESKPSQSDLQSIDLTVDIPEDFMVLADEGLLRRALANLIRNAIRYAGNRGPIRVRASRMGDLVEWVLTDSGPGVPEKALERIFDPFYRVDPARERSTGGVGLGLAIVRTCISACHGTVQAMNRPTGGLQVIVRLPRAAVSREETVIQQEVGVGKDRSSI